MKESDLYPPVKQFLESQGYGVKGEVQDCDVLSVRGEEEPVIVELKLSLNLNVILQVVERLSRRSPFGNELWGQPPRPGHLNSIRIASPYRLHNSVRDSATPDQQGELMLREYR